MSSPTVVLKTTAWSLGEALSTEAPKEAVWGLQALVVKQDIHLLQSQDSRWRPGPPMLIQRLQLCS